MLVSNTRSERFASTMGMSVCETKDENEGKMGFRQIIELA